MNYPRYIYTYIYIKPRTCKYQKNLTSKLYKTWLELAVKNKESTVVFCSLQRALSKLSSSLQ